MTVDDRLGRLDVRGEEVTMTFRRRLPYSIDAVWAAITDPAQRETWFGTTTIEARAGGAIFTHHGLGLRNAQGFLPGTHAFLDRLSAHLAAEKIPDWGRLYELLAPAYR